MSAAGLDPYAPQAPDTDGEIQAFDAAALRLRSRTRWGAALVMLATLMPYELIDGIPQFPWHLAGELHPAGLVAYLSPFLAGLVILGASFKLKSPLALALTVLTALGATALCIRLGADATAWEVVPLPDVLARRPTASMLSLALVAAGANLMFQPRTRGPGKVFLIGAMVVALVFYAWPDRGQPPLDALMGAMSNMMLLPDWRMRLGAVVMAALVLWPGIVALLGLAPLNFPPKDNHPVVGLVALYGYPLLLGMFVFRTLAALPDPWAVYSGAGGVAVMVGVMVVLTSALEVVADHAFCRPSIAQAPKRPFTFALGALVVISVAQLALSRPPAKGVDWTLKPATAEGDALFSEILPAWNFARLRWARRMEGSSGAEAMVDLKRASREVREAARALDPVLGEAFTAFTKGARELDVAGRRWHRMVGDLNEIIRSQGLPYYLDPTVRVYKHSDGLKRHFRMRTYRVHRVRRFAFQDDPEGDRYAALTVTRLDERGGLDTRLGFSRDLQPFALVVEDEAEDFRKALIEGLEADPPTCGTESMLSRSAVMMACGEALQTLAEGMSADDLNEMIVTTTERHEVQHQIDGPHLPMSAAVLGHMSQYGDKTQARVNRELSAYIAELTTPNASPRLGLIHLARFAASRRFGTEHHVALIALEALSEMPTMDLLGEADEAAVVQAFRTLMTMPDEQLRARAAAAWGMVFDEDLSALVALDP